jgi:hypothetical protein
MLDYVSERRKDIERKERERYRNQREIKNEDFPLLEETERRGFIRIRNKNTRSCKEQTNLIR